MDPKTTNTLCASVTIIPSALQKSEHENSKKAVSECSLAKISIEDVCLKETCIEESQNIEHELETSDSGGTGTSGYVSVESKESSGEVRKPRLQARNLTNLQNTH